MPADLSAFESSSEHSSTPIRADETSHTNFEVSLDEVDPGWVRNCVDGYQRVNGTFFQRHFFLTGCSAEIAILVPVFTFIYVVARFLPGSMLLILEIPAIALLCITLRTYRRGSRINRSNNPWRERALRILALQPCPHCRQPLAETGHKEETGIISAPAISVCPKCGKPIGPWAPIRKEYEPSRHPESIAPSQLREQLGVPNLWIPMRYAQSFRTLSSTNPYFMMLSMAPGYERERTRWRHILVLSPLAIVDAVLIAVVVGGLLWYSHASDIDWIASAILLTLVCLVSMLHRNSKRFDFHDLEARFLNERPCLACGYSLMNLKHRDGEILRCPECGASLTTLDICLQSTSSRQSASVEN